VHHGFLEIVVLLFLNVTPVPLKLASGDSSSGTVVIGASSHVLPLIRGINWIGHPVRKWLVPLDTKALKQNAVKKIRHNDFGDLNDWDAFERWVETCNDRCHLFGRIAMLGSLSNVLETHLFINKLFQDHPEIQSEVINKPIFLSSFTRTGATFLYQVLADTFNDELRPNYSFEVFGGPVELEDPPKRKETTQVIISLLAYMNSPLKLMHEWITPDDPEEDSGWYMHTGRGLAIPFNIPSLWHSTQMLDHSSHVLNQQYFETILKIKQWKSGKKQRFILKAPEHLFGLPHLDKTYPDAKFVTVFRDEHPCYVSGLVLTHQWQRLFVTPKVEETTQFMDILICNERKALEVAHNGTYNVLKVDFAGMFTNTFDIVSRFAIHAELPWDAQKQQHAKDVIAQRLSWKKTKAKYELEDFGLSDEKIANRLLRVCDNLPEHVDDVRVG
jgi:hypothetical protein